MSSFKDTLSKYFVDKAPKLPEKVKDVLVIIAPWLTIVSVVGMATAALSWLKWQNQFRAMNILFPGATVSLALNVASAVIMAMAIRGLFARTRKAWDLVFAASVIGIVGEIISINIVSAIISFIISMYFLFQLRDRYTA